MAFSILAWYQLETSISVPTATDIVRGPIWKMPCNDLIITYFQAEEMRIYVKHNFNMNIFIVNSTFKNSTYLYHRYVILITTLTKIQQILQINM